MTDKWYPSDWLDEDGNPLPGVFEYSGEKCPIDKKALVSVLRLYQREEKSSSSLEAGISSTFGWDNDAGGWAIVAYKIEGYCIKYPPVSRKSNTRLSEEERDSLVSFFKLIERSPDRGSIEDRGERWKSVSPLLESLVKDNVSRFPELFDLVENYDKTLRVKISFLGSQVWPYI